VTAPEGVAGADGAAAPATRRGSRRAFLLWALFFAAVFAFMGVRVFLALRSPFLPARHLDLEASSLRPFGPDGARLTLVLLHAAGESSVRYETQAPQPGVAPFTVRLHASGSARPDPEGGEPLTLRIDLPRVGRVRVLDLRWDHPDEHPQGHDFELEGGEDA
jgi:hypothetical protein